MYCMKCGKEIKENQVFCEACLVTMGKYPVKPGTVVRLPQRKSAPAAKKSNSRRRTQIPPEEQVKNLLVEKTGFNPRAFQVNVIEEIPKFQSGKLNYPALQKMI